MSPEPLAPVGRGTGRFAGEVAIVTGAAQGIGFATASLLAEEGATVFLADINAEKVEAAAERIRDRGGSAEEYVVDLTEEQGVAALVEKAQAHAGRIDILVNLAAIQPPFVPFEERVLADWRRVVAATLDSTFLCCRAVIPTMKRASYGRIVNTSSGTIHMGLEGLAPYVTAKAGIIGMTRVLARELGEHGITANVIMPGLTETEHTLSMFATAAETDAHFDAIVSHQCIKRRGQVEDVAHCVAYIVSREAVFLTGQTLNVSNGLNFN